MGWTPFLVNVLVIKLYKLDIVLFCRAVTLGEYLGDGKKVLLVMIRQFSCLLCRLHLQELQEQQVD